MLLTQTILSDVYLILSDLSNFKWDRARCPKLSNAPTSFPTDFRIGNRKISEFQNFRFRMAPLVGMSSLLFKNRFGFFEQTTKTIKTTGDKQRYTDESLAVEWCHKN